MSFPRIFETNSTTFETLGYGVLSDAISCTVTENLNGAFELEMRYPVNGLHAEYIMTNNLIVCNANKTAIGQAFRIYEVLQEINGIATIHARHISYDLNGYPIEPFTATTLAGAITGLMSSVSPFTPPFTVSADFSATRDFAVTEPSSIRSWFGGREGSLIDIYGGEWEYDNFNCYLRSRRGADNNVRVQYGRNISTYTKDIVSDSVYSHVCAFWKDEESGTTVVSDYVPTGNSEVTRVKYIDTSFDYLDAPEASTLTALATSQAGDYASPGLTITAGVIPMNDIQDNIELGDTVHVYYQNDMYTTRCVTVVWNVLKDKYDNISVGTLKTSMSETVTDTVALDGYITRRDAAAMIQKASPVRIVESGTNNGWKYKKYSDGTYEAFKRLTLSEEACTTTWGSLYVTAAKDFGDRPTFDSSGLEIFVTYASSDGHSGWASNWGAISGLNTGTWVVVRPSSQASMSGYLSAQIFSTYSGGGGGGGGRAYVTQDAEGYIVLPSTI